jgi:hypothetical protein
MGIESGGTVGIESDNPKLTGPGISGRMSGLITVSIQNERGKLYA